MPSPRGAPRASLHRCSASRRQVGREGGDRDPAENEPADCADPDVPRLHRRARPAAGASAPYSPP
eukprot:136645-Prymnesium_polylepis.1